MDKNEKDKLFTRVPSDAVAQNNGLDDMPSQNPAKNISDNINAEVEKMVKNDLDVIRSLMETGIVSREQGQNLMTEVIENAYRCITKQDESQPETPASVPNTAKQDAFADFLTSNSEFFNRKGRDSVLDYLKKSNVNFDRDELLQISKLIEAVELGAVERYLQKIEYGKTLNDENNIAKQRLTANAQNSNASDNNMVFTRAQIGKMSGDEFAKYESLIMDQLRKGLIH